MTLELEEFEKFMEVLQKQDIEKMHEEDLRKAVRNFWNIGSNATVDNRLQVLVEEGWLERPKYGGDVWKVKEKEEDEVAMLFKKEGEKRKV